MVYKCSAPCCKQGYSSIAKDPNVSFHRFPIKDPKMLAVWVNAISKDTSNWTPSINSRLCSLHFTETDFIIASVDKSRDKGKSLQLRRLKDDAIPSQFLELTNPQTPSKPKRSLTRSQKLQIESESEEALDNEMFIEERVHSAQELYEKLSLESLPSGFSLLKSPKVAIVKIIHLDEKGLDIGASLEVEEDLSFQIFYRHVQLKNSSVSHYLNSNGIITSVTEAINVTAFLQRPRKFNIQCKGQEYDCKAQ